LDAVRLRIQEREIFVVTPTSVPFGEVGMIVSRRLRARVTSRDLCSHRRYRR